VDVQLQPVRPSLHGELEGGQSVLARESGHPPVGDPERHGGVVRVREVRARLYLTGMQTGRQRLNVFASRASNLWTE
jgi:hypothetical protein